MNNYKFRGKDINGHYVFGLLIKKLNKNTGKIGWAIATGSATKLSEFVPVSENSVAQLIGYDCNGDEVYEDDVLKNYDDEFVATYALKFWKFGEIFKDCELVKKE